jgi:hypothetical protein
MNNNLNNINIQKMDSMFTIKLGEYNIFENMGQMYVTLMANFRIKCLFPHLNFELFHFVLPILEIYFL